MSCPRGRRQANGLEVFRFPDRARRADNCADQVNAVDFFSAVNRGIGKIDDAIDAAGAAVHHRDDRMPINSEQRRGLFRFRRSFD
jgi:hypothetical protein